MPQRLDVLVALAVVIPFAGALLYLLLRLLGHEIGWHWYDKTERFASGVTVYTCRVCGRCEVKNVAKN